jgi:hypothetical protein
MADQQKHKADEATETLSPTQLAMIKAIAEAMKTPYVDPEIAARNLRAKTRLRDERELAEANKASIEDQCSHMREDNTSRVAWIVNYHTARKLYITEGFCQLCNKHYRPGVAGYEAMLKLPVGKAGVIQ